MDKTKWLREYGRCSMVVSTLAITACSVFEAPDPDGGSGRGGRDAASTNGSAGKPWWIVKNQQGCETARVPNATDRPAVSDPGEDLKPIYFAMSRIRGGSTLDDEALTRESGAWQEIGFDMDGVCTNSATCEVNQVKVNERACSNSSATPYDGKACRDNELGKLFDIATQSPTLAELFGFTEQDWNCELHRGGFSMIFRISNYNGKLNDRDIRFDMYTSTGLQQLPGWMCRATMDAALNPEWYKYAKWLSNAHWKISKQSIDPTTSSDSGMEVPNAQTADSAAFVRDGYFFAKIPDGREFWWNGERATVPGFRDTMHRGVIVGRLVRQSDDSWAVDNGTLAFVVTPDEMLSGYKEIGICDNMCNTFKTIKDYNTSHQDVLIATDEKLADTPCNALSMGLDFDARQVTATASDVETIKDPVACPEPRHPRAPRQGCVCQTDGTTCIFADAGGN
jgi:hypothetical protein